jgi:hypothetical protein
MLNAVIPLTFDVPCSSVQYSNGFITTITNKIPGYVRYRLDDSFGRIHFDFEMAQDAMAGGHH